MKTAPPTPKDRPAARRAHRAVEWVESVLFMLLIHRRIRALLAALEDLFRAWQAGTLPLPVRRTAASPDRQHPDRAPQHHRFPMPPGSATATFMPAAGTPTTQHLPESSPPPCFPPRKAPPLAGRNTGRIIRCWRPLPRRCPARTPQPCPSSPYCQPPAPPRARCLQNPLPPALYKYALIIPIS